MSIIPMPQSQTAISGVAGWNKNTQIKGKCPFPKAGKTAEKLLAARGEGEKSELIFVSDAALPAEGYTIEVRPGSITVAASGEAGAFYALMSLEQSAEGGTEVACCKIKDAPKYAYRGFMLDCARHFWTTDKIKSILDVMAMLKMNIFHWHLSEDQGWRAEIKKYPLLTQKGSIRRNTQLSLKGYYQHKEAHDDVEYGRGLYYTQEQMKDIVAYAANLHIDVVPEIDMPGHMVAAIACYPELSCTGEATEVSTRWGVMDNICCCGKDNIFNFARDVIDELCEIFPSHYFHIGGDEVPKTRWKKCPACQKKIKELGLKDENALQGYFNNEIAKYLRSKGKRMIGWNEILDAADIMEKDIVAQWWTRHGVNNEAKWMAAGGKCLLSMCSYIYMDHPYNVRPLSKTYSLTAAKLGIKDKSGVLGMEIPQWTEYIRDENKLDMLTFARLVTFAEVCWTNDEIMDYKDFETRLEEKRGYFASKGCRICPQKVYRGKAHPWYMLSVAQRWALWRENCNYEMQYIEKNNLKF